MPLTPSFVRVAPRACRRCRLVPSLPPPGTHLAPHYTRPPFDSGRAQTPCPPPTSCSSAARGRAPRPSPPLAMARAGLREAARERSSARELLRLVVIYLREPQQHPYRTLTVWSRLVSATAFVAFELYDAIFFRALQPERVRCVDVYCDEDAERSEAHVNRPFHVSHLGHTPLN